MCICMNKDNKLTMSWKDFSYDLPYRIVTIPEIRKSLNSLWSEIYSDPQSHQDMIFIQFKVRTGRHLTRSISYVQRVGYSDLNQLLSSFLGFWSVRSDLYKVEQFYQIVYTYKMIPKINMKSSIITSKMVGDEKTNYFKFHGYDLPSTMDYRSWGIVVESKPIIVYKPKSKIEYHIHILEDKQEVSLFSNGRYIMSFTNILLDLHDLSTFYRSIQENAQSYLFIKGSLSLKTVIREHTHLSSLSPVKQSIFKVITMDIETREENDQLIPYCISLYDGKSSYSFYLSDYGSVSDMLESAIRSIMRRKYNGYRVYLHNFSRFDGVFLLKVLALLSDDVTPIIREDRIIELRLKYGLDKKGKYQYQLIFRDSYLLLSHSLKDLTNTFQVDRKGIFPYRFVNSAYTYLDYVGAVPAFDYFDNINLDAYHSYCQRYSNWSLKRETIVYCENDCRSLYQVLSSFHDQIYTYFQIDFLKYPTVSSLALAIYRTHFLSSEKKVPLIGGEMFTDMHEGYTGGAVDVYRPYGQEVYRYDVNSLYPKVMKNGLMPTGVPFYFEGDITLLEHHLFGIFEVEIKAPLYLNRPILQHRMNVEGGTRTISPVGTWKGIYFSEELFNAIRQGYEVNIVKGYLFESEYLFKDYVSYLYDLKMSSDKCNPVYTIAKLLLNSLYGRFGMDPTKEIHSIVGFSESFKICSQYEVTNVIHLSPEKELISYKKDSKDISVPNISIPISAAVTAYARMAMSTYKYKSSFHLYYTDTDSIDILNILNPIKVGRELGMMKLERYFDQAIFLAPKVYGGILEHKECVRIKGLKDTIAFSSLSDLLIKNNKLVLSQDKWYKNIELGVLEIRQELYTLIATENKRALIYHPQKENMNTSPFILHKGTLVPQHKWLYSP